MAQITLVQTYCDQWLRELELIRDQLEQVQQLVKFPTKLIRQAMKAMMDEVESASNDINNAVSDIASDITDSIPPIPTEVDELLALAQQCGLIEESFSIQGPEAMVQNILAVFTDGIAAVLEQLETSLSNILEYPVAKAINDINEILKRFNLSEQFDKLDKYRDCANALCGGQLSATIDEIDAILADLYLDTNGFDYTSFGYQVASDEGHGAGYFDNYSGNISSLLTEVDNQRSAGETEMATIGQQISDLTKGLF